MSSYNPSETTQQNYVQSKLDDFETQQFEMWLVNHPEVVADLELDQMFRQARHSYFKEEQKQSSFSFVDFFASRKLLPFHVLAYSLLILLTFNSLFDNSSEVQTSAAIFIELEKQRGAETPAIEVKAEKNKSLVLRFFPDSMTQEYSLVMESKSSNQNFKFEKLKADEFGAITVLINTKSVNNNSWEILILNHQNIEEQKYMINSRRN